MPAITSSPRRLITKASPSLTIPAEIQSAMGVEEGDEILWGWDGVSLRVVKEPSTDPGLHEFEAAAAKIMDRSPRMFEELSR